MERRDGREDFQLERIRTDWVRLPGLYRRFEFERVIEVGRAFYIEEAGKDAQGWTVHRVFYRPVCIVPPAPTDPHGGGAAFAGRAA